MVTLADQEEISVVWHSLSEYKEIAPDRSGRVSGVA
jgi:hypothetical protein